MIGPLRRWLARRTSTGPRGERIAARFLRRAGYRIVSRNLSTRAGELDIIALAPDRRTVVFVEVKASAISPSGQDPTPELRVGLRKQQRITGLASAYLRRFGLTGRPARFDVVAVVFGRDKKPTVRHHPGAFESHV